MELDRTSATTALQEIEAAENRTTQAVIYGYGANHLLLWGALVTVGYVATQFLPDRMPYLFPLVWPLIWLIGIIGSTVLAAEGKRQNRRSERSSYPSLLLIILCLIVFGTLQQWLFGPLTPRQLNVYWPMLSMLAYVIVGLWIGRFFIACGLGVMALSVLGYLYVGQWLPLYMAVADGGALMLGGLYLRRVGLRL